MDPKRNSPRKNLTRSPSPKFVGLARNTFGTRLCQRIVCARCEKVDHVPVRVKAAKDTFCRDCAEKILATYDQGRQIAEKKVSRVCEQCGHGFKVNESVAEKKDQLMCSDCFRGFEVWRGKGKESYTPVQKRAVLTKIGSRTTFRKNINDTV